MLALAACRGEKIPRDYQNNPPAMTHPVTSSSQSPDAHGMPGAAPQPSKGAEGNNVTRQPTSPNPPTYTLGDQAPTVTDTQHATQTGGTSVTGTQLHVKP
ncbi:MAG TPA: hypothetical protein VG323_02815 [Thermoanaerobaculia bacterium]|nr:hypothetical protein [Thermoanaerobaculia bacterium]